MFGHSARSEPGLYKGVKLARLDQSLGSMVREEAREVVQQSEYYK